MSAADAINSLLLRLRPNVECAPWVVEELKRIAASDRAAQGGGDNRSIPQAPSPEVVAEEMEFGPIYGHTDATLRRYGDQCFHAGVKQASNGPAAEAVGVPDGWVLVPREPEWETYVLMAQEFSLRKSPIDAMKDAYAVAISSIERAAAPSQPEGVEP